MSALELIVRPFESIVSTPSARAIPQPPDPLQPPAFIRWGQPGDFTENNFRADALDVLFGFTSDTDPEPDKRPRVKYKLLARGWYPERRYQRIEKIEGDLIFYDPDQYIVVRDASALTFQGPHGVEFTLHLSPPKDQSFIPGSGQTPEDPPPIDEIDERPEWLAWHTRHPGG